MSHHDQDVDGRYYGNRNSLHDSGVGDVSALSSKPMPTSPLAQSFAQSQTEGRQPLQDRLTLGRRQSVKSAATDRDEPSESYLHRSTSAASHRSHKSTTSAVSNTSRSNTLRKQKSLSRKSSLKKKGSKRSVRAGSIGGITYDDTSGENFRNVFHTPVPTTGSPTDILTARFQGWRKVLKDLIVYIKELQAANEAKVKITEKVSKTIGGLALPLGFKQADGIGEANEILKQHHKQLIAEGVKAREVHNEVVNQLSNLRSDLQQKIKEIKSLSGDFKNNIEKEKENTKKIVSTLQESLAAVDTEAKAMVGKDDPYIVRLAVERQVERQIDEENYLHRAYQNIEGSGRELEAIVVGEIQKAYKAIASILKKEVDDNERTINRLEEGPIDMAKDAEWDDFVRRDPHFISPDIAIRKAQDLEYPGKSHPAAAEVRAGMLERKSKYLKSYTPGWFVLSPTHLHEFKSADAVYTQAPIVSLYLHDQKLGARSQADSNSYKFILKGRQTGGMHRGHSWVFRAETYDTMLAWYDDIKVLTETSGEERDAYVLRGRARSFSSHSARSMDSFDEEDEADNVPFNASHRESMTSGAGSHAAVQESKPTRPQGGRFPSDLQIRREGLVRGLTPSSDGSEVVQDIGTAAGLVVTSPDSLTTPAYVQNDPVDQPFTQQVPAHTLPAAVETSSLQSHRAEIIDVAPVPPQTEADGVLSATIFPPAPAPPQPTRIESNAWLRGTESPAAVPSAVANQFVTEPEVDLASTAIPATGKQSMPNMRRVDTGTSVSNLHVPGEYPKPTPL